MTFISKKFMFLQKICMQGFKFFNAKIQQKKICN